MKPVDLKTVNASQLLGKWKVQSRILSRSDPASPFALAEMHELHDGGTYILTSGVDQIGRWDISSDESMVRNPLIRFTLDQETTNAIITRLLYADDNEHAQLTIYLATGLELVLLKTQNPKS